MGTCMDLADVVKPQICISHELVMLYNIKCMKTRQINGIFLLNHVGLLYIM